MGKSANLSKFSLDKPAEMFDWIDSDSTGVITLEEMRVALDYHLGSQFKEDQMERLKDMMELQDLDGIPKDMFVEIMHDITTRMRVKELVDDRNRSNSAQSQLVNLDETAEIEDPDSGNKRVSSTERNEDVLQRFALGIGITQNSLQDKLTQEMATKEKLNERVMELRKAALLERKNQERLLANIAEDQQSLEKQNEGLIEANRRLGEHVEEMANELENAKMLMLTLEDNIENLESRRDSLLEQLKSAEMTIEDTKRELENLKEENSELKDQLEEAKSESMESSLARRKISISQSAITAELVRQKQQLEEKLKIAKAENRELRLQLASQRKKMEEQQRILEATNASVAFWKKQTRRGSGVGTNLAAEIAALAVNQSNSSRAKNSNRHSAVENGTPPIIMQPTDAKFSNDSPDLTRIENGSFADGSVEDNPDRGSAAYMKEKLLRDDSASDGKSGSQEKKIIDSEQNSNPSEQLKLQKERTAQLAAKLKETQGQLEQITKKLKDLESRPPGHNMDGNGGSCCWC
uniref:EF-hand domain-containing protein n=1 Tax=Norrisiella sphaerica TaxID=552664 RepID=A0A7S2VVI2_9EUKA|mmetsp:Transcript_365/g.531  ORF Transcript_365/g.531 Transcript_365/m.531 type:complete len:523 (+) Transcript_365:522-2090(+)